MSDVKYLGFLNRRHATTDNRIAVTGHFGQQLLVLLERIGQRLAIDDEAKVLNRFVPNPPPQPPQRFLALGWRILVSQRQQLHTSLEMSTRVGDVDGRF